MDRQAWKRRPDLQQNEVRKMLDRNIPFYNTILRCDRYTPTEVILPDGFSIVPYRGGYEKAWAKLEYAIEDFDSEAEAESYFVSTYLPDGEKRKNCLFLLNPEKQVIGSCIAWQDRRGNQLVSSLHWLVVEEEYQGRGLGKALCLAVMNLFARGGGNPVYIHTQPWSWKAILLYISIGFRLQQTDTFSHYENQYDKAMETLKSVVPEMLFERMKDSSEQ